MSDLLDAVETARENIQRLADPCALRTATEQVIEFARACGAHTVVAASPAAERLVGALLSSTASLADLSTACGLETGPVLIVDINLASGTALALAARRARKAGALRVLAVVLHQLTVATASAVDCGVDEISILQSAPTLASASPNGSGLW